MASSSSSLLLMVVPALVMMMCGFAAADPDSLQDVCVADLTAGVKMNGFACKEGNISAADFFFAGLAKEAQVNNSMGSVATPANVMKIPGLNTLGVSMSRVDYAPNGLNPPHTHPRATEIAFLLQGQLEVGFITTNNLLVSKTINKGEVFVFPKGLVHYQKNNDPVHPASAIAAFDSQFPGTQSIPATLFAASPHLPDTVLSAAFHIGTKEVGKIKSKFAKK